jgi:MFS family permease
MGSPLSGTHKNDIVILRMANLEAEIQERRTLRNTFFNLGVFEFLTFLRRGVFYTFMIYYLYKLMNTVTSTAALGAMTMVASSLGQNLLWGRICDRYKIRAKLIVMGETIAASAYLIVFLVHKSLIEGGNRFAAGLAIIFGLSILEFFWSMSDVGWAALLTDITTPDTRGRVVGSMNFIASLGRMVGILYSGFLYLGGEGFENGAIFYIVIGFLLSGAALMALTSRRIGARSATLQEGACSKKEVEETDTGIQSEKTYHWFLASLVIVVLGAASINQIFLLFLQLPQGVNFTDTEVTIVTSAWTVGGMMASLGAGRLSDRFGRSKVLLLGLSFAVATPLLYPYASTVPLMALTYGFNGVSFWTIQTVGFVLAGDLIPKHRRGRLLSRFNAVLALSWGPAGILIGGPFADLQVQRLGLSSYASYVNAFYVSSIMVAVGTAVFAAKVARLKHD